jgi:hypothetical protein
MESRREIHGCRRLRATEAAAAHRPPTTQPARRAIISSRNRNERIAP